MRTEKNKPVADLAFWTEALRTRQRDAGYTALGEGTTKAASGQPGAPGQHTQPAVFKVPKTAGQGRLSHAAAAVSRLERKGQGRLTLPFPH